MNSKVHVEESSLVVEFRDPELLGPLKRKVKESKT
jgi:hypothetical protein